MTLAVKDANGNTVSLPTGTYDTATGALLVLQPSAPLPPGAAKSTDIQAVIQALAPLATDADLQAVTAKMEMVRALLAAVLNVQGTVTSNLGTLNGAALDASVQSAVAGLATLHVDVGANHADLQAILTQLGKTLAMALPAGASTDASVQAVTAAVAALRTALGTPAQAGGAVSVSNQITGFALDASLQAIKALLSGTLAVSNASLPLPAGAATDANLVAILNALKAQIDIAPLFVTDGTHYYVRREQVNEGTSAISIVFENIDGTAASPTVGSLTPIVGSSSGGGSSASTVYIEQTLFDATAAATGYAVGDVLARAVFYNTATSSVSGTAWLNLTQGTTLSATPAAANISEQTRNIAVTSCALPAGAARDATLSSILSALQAVLNVTGTVTANIGTTNGLGLDATLQAIKTALGSPLQTGSTVTVGGAVAPGQAPTVNPVGVSGVDGGGLKRALLTDTTGALALAAGENHVGQIGGTTSVAVATLTRPANTTAYASGQLMANSTAAGSVAPVQFTAARKAGGTGRIPRARVSSSNPAAGNVTVRVHLYKGSAAGVGPTSAVGDGGTFSGSVNGVTAVEIDSFDVTLSKVFSDGAKGVGVPSVGGYAAFDTYAGSQLLFALLECRSSYTPASGETFTVALEIDQD